MPVNVVTMPLPHDRRWVWFEDAQILALSPELNAAGRSAAVAEMVAEWGGKVQAVAVG